MATAMLDNGADVRHVQEMLGHRQLTTTQRYTYVSIARLKAVHAATHPAANPARAGGAGGAGLTRRLGSE
jgi:integrase/recombinase XerD